jgi:hypothetical protein
LASNVAYITTYEVHTRPPSPRLLSLLHHPTNSCEGPPYCPASILSLLILVSASEQVILDEKGRATGVVLRGGRRIHARKAVVSGASVWDTLKLLPAERLPAEWRQAAAATPACPSFMHLHVGFDGAGGC